MKLSHLRQYQKLASFLYKYGTSDLVKHSGLTDALDFEPEEKEAVLDVKPEELVQDIKDMGPAFIKFGQLLSTRPDLLPAPFIKALEHLQDDIEPFSYEEAEELVQEELGERISKAFHYFEEEPLAAASLGQVHRAQLRSGVEVVVKIQRPGIRKRVMEDLEVLETAAGFLERNTSFGSRFELVRLVENFRKTLLRELDYTKEAEYMRMLQRNLVEFDHIVVPMAVGDYTSSRVLTMEYLPGKKITAISGITKTELDGDTLADELFRAYLKQIVVDGFMHADPHPGNIHLMPDGRLALLDVGMVAFISESMRQKYLQLLLALSEAKSDKVVQLLIDMSKQKENTNVSGFRDSISDLVQQNRNVTMQSLQTGRILFAIIQAAGENGYLLPVELSLVAKALLNLDQVSKTLAPDFAPNKAIRKHAMDIMRRHMWSELAPENFFDSVLESKRLIETLPERLNKILHKASENELRFKIDAFDERHMMVGLQKIANRITMGLILAALVVGSALLMRVPTSFTIFGYPGLAIVCFLLAVVGALWLLIRTVLSDE
ncbi:MAG: ABC transporter [Owenweeksia sp.]|nr:ABC transporter [Owenweeksia sp.]|tara:strand:- start:224 stop:1867 length:1644 start_codon:yes stop_codon:yes gene_type:complete